MGSVGLGMMLRKIMTGTACRKTASMAWERQAQIMFIASKVSSLFASDKLVYKVKEDSDWLAERPEFCNTDDVVGFAQQ